MEICPRVGRDVPEKNKGFLGTREQGILNSEFRIGYCEFRISSCSLSAHEWAGV